MDGFSFPREELVRYVGGGGGPDFWDFWVLEFGEKGRGRGVVGDRRGLRWEWLKGDVTW